MYNPFSLSGKTILITGASSGIGKSIAIECSKMGALLVITGRDEQRLEKTFNELDGHNHLMISADLTIENNISRLADVTPKLDGLVHGAGMVKPKPFQFLNRKELDEIMDINFQAPVLLTNQLIRGKKVNKNASIVFISSVSGTSVSFIGGSAYSASKGALNGIIKGMALEMASKQIRVNSVVPGMIDTGIFDQSGISSEDLLNDRKKYPLGRYGKPEEVAFAAIYLLSDASSWSTGSNILLDGGFTLL